MARCAGMWLDSEQAVVVFVCGDQTDVRRIQSHVEGHFRLSGGARSATPYGPQDIASETNVERRRKHQYGRYYDEIVKALSDAEAILILGPGEVKTHLAKEICKDSKLSAVPRRVEAADKMTERQLVAHVKTYFSSRYSCRD